MKQSMKQVAKYGIVGIIGLVIDLGIFYLLVDAWQVAYPFADNISQLFDWLGIKNTADTSNILVSNIISSFLAIVNNFILNSYFTFKVKDDKLKRFLNYMGIALLGMLLSTFLLTIFIDYLLLNPMFAKIIAIVIVAAIQFFLNKYLTFKHKQPKPHVIK